MTHETLSLLIGAFCLGAGLVSLLIPFTRREVYVTDNPTIHREMTDEGHAVRLVTSQQWINELLMQARREALDAGMNL